MQRDDYKLHSTFFLSLDLCLSLALSFSLSFLWSFSCADVRHVGASQYGMMVETSHELEVNSVHQSVLCSHFGLSCLTAFNSLCVQKLCVVTAIRHTHTHTHTYSQYRFFSLAYSAPPPLVPLIGHMSNIQKA